MTPALEYLIRSDLIRQWFSPPCSLFLTRNNGDKLVVTISEEFKPSDKFSVKHWNLATCAENQVLPSMNEYSVLKQEIFNSPHTILKDCRLLLYEQELIREKHNSYRSPMVVELYQYYFDNLLVSPQHRCKKVNWLWKTFILIYAPKIYPIGFSQYLTEFEIAELQRELVAAHLKKHWQYWLKWQQYMLLSSGELFFHKGYST